MRALERNGTWVHTRCGARATAWMRKRSTPKRRDKARPVYSPRMAPRPSKTTNRIHFTDLDPGRFEDLCLALVFPLHPWTELRHYGRSGADDGVDILGVERTEDGTAREWRIQCRRYAKATAATLRKAVNDVLSRPERPPDVMLLVVACDVSRKAQEAYARYAASRGIRTPLIWTASLLEARMYSDRRDLLFSYFGISTAPEARSRDATIIRNIALKKRLRRELRKDNGKIDWESARRRPYEKFQHRKMIIHSVDDTSYPDHDPHETGISGWFRLELWDFYFNGLEFVIGIDGAVADEDGSWAILPYGAPFDASVYEQVKLFRLARIPFASIVECDLDGDEYYPEPHLYCRFEHGGAPYEGFRFVRADGDYPWAMDEERQFTLGEKPRAPVEPEQ